MPTKATTSKARAKMIHLHKPAQVSVDSKREFRLFQPMLRKTSQATPRVTPQVTDIPPVPEIDTQEDLEDLQYSLKWQEIQVLSQHNADARQRDADARKRDSDMRERDRLIAESVARQIAAQNEPVDLARARLKRKRQAEDTEDKSSGDESSGGDGPGGKRSKAEESDNQISDDEVSEAEEESSDDEKSDDNSPEGSAHDAGPVFRKLEPQEWHSGPWAPLVQTSFPQHVPDLPTRASPSRRAIKLQDMTASPGRRAIKLQEGNSR